MTGSQIPDGGALTGEEVLTLLRNVGVDITCGACVGIAYTGYALEAHTCGAPTPHVVMELLDDPVDGSS